MPTRSRRSWRSSSTPRTTPVHLDFAYPGLEHSPAVRGDGLTPPARVSAAARKDVATPAVISTLRELVAAEDPGTAAVARTALTELGLSVPTRTIPRRKCRRLG